MLAGFVSCGNLNNDNGPKIVSSWKWSEDMGEMMKGEGIFTFYDNGTFTRTMKGTLFGHAVDMSASGTYTGDANANGTIEITVTSVSGVPDELKELAPELNKPETVKINGDTLTYDGDDYKKIAGGTTASGGTGDDGGNSGGGTNGGGNEGNASNGSYTYKQSEWYSYELKYSGNDWEFYKTENIGRPKTKLMISGTFEGDFSKDGDIVFTCTKQGDEYDKIREDDIPFKFSGSLLASTNLLTINTFGTAAGSANEFIFMKHLTKTSANAEDSGKDIKNFAGEWATTGENATEKLIIAKSGGDYGDYYIKIGYNTYFSEDQDHIRVFGNKVCAVNKSVSMGNDYSVGNTEVLILDFGADKQTVEETYCVYTIEKGLITDTKVTKTTFVKAGTNTNDNNPSEGNNNESSGGDSGNNNNESGDPGNTTGGGSGGGNTSQKTAVEFTLTRSNGRIDTFKFYSDNTFETYKGNELNYSGTYTLTGDWENGSGGVDYNRKGSALHWDFTISNSILTIDEENYTKVQA